MRDSNLTTMRRRVGAKVSRMSADDCAAWLEEFTSEGITAINHDTVRRLTGGYCSQNIASYVMRKVFDALKTHKAATSRKAEGKATEE